MVVWLFSGKIMYLFLVFQVMYVWLIFMCNIKLFSFTCRVYMVILILSIDIIFGNVYRGLRLTEQVRG